MTEKEYKQAMKEAKKEFTDWLKDNKRARLFVKKASAKIRKANLKARNK